MPNQYTTPNLEIRFWSKVAITANDELCWEWQATKVKGPYGQFTINRQPIMAHRMSWTLTYGEIPEGLCVCHKCDNPLCVNPKHLFLGTYLENIRDKVKKNRQAKGVNHGRAKLSVDDVLYIRSRYKEGGITERQLAKQFGIHHSYAHSILKGEVWKDLLKQAGLLD